MNELPFDIPPSLLIYQKAYHDNPKKGIEMLESLAKKRRNDPLVHFLLAFFYHGADDKVNAFRHAGKATGLAPGSPLMQYLGYYLTHPDGFGAWLPDVSIRKSSKKPHALSDIHFDLDTLISKLTRAEKKKIRLSPSDEGEVKDLGKDSTNTGGLATNTLAVIYEKQGKIAEAIEVYEKMLVKKPEKEAVYKAEIERLKGLVAGA